MKKFGFGSDVVVVDDAGTDVAVSGDRQAFTATFSKLEVFTEPGIVQSAPLATRAASFVVPIEGAGEDVRIALRVSGHAIVAEGATGLLVMAANGQSRTEELLPGLDNEILFELQIAAPSASECRVSLFLVAERDSAQQFAAVRFNVLSVDAEFIRSGALQR